MSTLKRTLHDYVAGARRPVEACVLVALGLQFVLWHVQWFVIPTGSMAETLVGWHREVTCSECRWRYACGLDDAPDDQWRAVCPNCGFHGDTLRGPDVTGDRLLVDRTAFQLRAPERWEIAAFRSPLRSRSLFVKRVVGLPHETIELRHGDVYANGELQRKPLAAQRAMAVLVHDDRFTPCAESLLPPRWSACGESAWRREGGVHVWQAAGDRPETAGARGQGTGDRGQAGGERALAAEEADTSVRSTDTEVGAGVAVTYPLSAVPYSRHPSNPKSKIQNPKSNAAQAALDWLVYRHWRRASRDDVAAADAPIENVHSYNQVRPLVEPRVVIDVMLVCRVRATGGGRLHVRGGDGHEDFVATLDLGAARAELAHFERRRCQTPPEGEAAAEENHVSTGESHAADDQRDTTAGESHATADGRHSTPGRGEASLDEALDDARRRSTLACDLPASWRLARGVELAASLVDRTFLLALDGEVVFTCPFAHEALEGEPTNAPFAVAAEELEVELRDLRVFRDVYYGDASQAFQLAGEEYFVLGDNTLLSADSRSWRSGPAVARHAMVGKPVLVYYPSRLVRLGGYAIQVPDLRRIRYIR